MREVEDRIRDLVKRNIEAQEAFRAAQRELAAVREDAVREVVKLGAFHCLDINWSRFRRLA